MKKITEKIGEQIFDIFIGRNAKENWDLIDSSEPFDLWFHVDDLPSGHVIIKERLQQNTSENPSYPNQIISIAAETCKSHSKYKDHKKLKIVYTEISNIKKGKEIGSVYVSKEKFIYI